MIEFRSGDVFATDASAIVNTVNCVGAQGRGVALGVKLRWPAVYDAYRRDCGTGLACDGGRDPTVNPTPDGVAPPCCAPGLACGVHRVRPGVVIARPTGEAGITTVLDLPTKRHWRKPSRLEDVEAGLRDLARVVRETGVPSLALPPPGCGNGGLSWLVVGPMAVSILRDLDARVTIHAPRV